MNTYNRQLRGIALKAKKNLIASRWRLLVQADRSTRALEAARAAGIPESTFRSTCYGARLNSASAEIIEEHYNTMLRDEQEQA